MNTKSNKHSHSQTPKSGQSILTVRRSRKSSSSTSVIMDTPEFNEPVMTSSTNSGKIVPRSGEASLPKTSSGFTNPYKLRSEHISPLKLGCGQTTAIKLRSGKVIPFKTITGRTSPTKSSSGKATPNKSKISPIIQTVSTKSESTTPVGLKSGLTPQSDSEIEKKHTRKARSERSMSTGFASVLKKLRSSSETPSSSQASGDGVRTQELIQQLKNLYVCGIPTALMNRNILHSHFLQYGRVVRMYLSMKRNSCTIHFDNHESAARAKAKGGTINDVVCSVFWSQPAKLGRAMKDDIRFTVRSPRVQETVPHEESWGSQEFMGESTYKWSKFLGNHPRFRVNQGDRRFKPTNFYTSPHDKHRVRQMLQYRKERISRELEKKKLKLAVDDVEIFSYPNVENSYELSNEVKGETAAISDSGDSMRTCHEKSGFNIKNSYTIPLKRHSVRRNIKPIKEKTTTEIGKSEDAVDGENIFAYPDVRRSYEISDEVKEELEIMACNDAARVTKSLPSSFKTSSKTCTSSGSTTEILAASTSSVNDFSALDSSTLKPSSSKERSEASDSSSVSSSASTSKTRVKKLKVFPAEEEPQSILSKMIEKWNTKTKQDILSSEERYQLLELRDKILRMKWGRESDLSKAKVTQGTCQDMCPEKERYQREARHQVAFYEYVPGTNKEMIMDHTLAVKQYSRSSADQEEPLPHELRPPYVLRMTMDYLLAKIMNHCEDKEENLGEWYHFLWDRTRGIRKDITQQELCDMDAVNLIEECARFHIHCSARLVAEDPSIFDNKINSENLTKCLQTLKYMYFDMAFKGIKCPNEAEFRGYIILLNLSDANFMWEMKDLEESIIHSEQVKFAVKVFLVLNSNNYVCFFKLVKRTTYLNACILLRYFYQVRSKALFTLMKSHCSGSQQSVLALDELTKLLAFENIRDAAVFCDHYGLELNDYNTEVILYKDAGHGTSDRLPVVRAVYLVESKRTCSVGEVVKGGPLSFETFENYKPYSSFNLDGTLNKEAIQKLNEMYYAKEKKMASTYEKMETDRADVPDTVDTTVVPYEEQAIAAAELVKSSEMMQDILYEIIQEELQVFNERLTNVALLELDELILDGTCNLTRECYKQAVVEEEENERLEKEREEKARKKEEEEKAAMEHEKVINMKTSKIMEEILQETTAEVIREIIEQEQNFHELSLETLDSILGEAIVVDCLDILKDEIRNKRCTLLARRRQISCLRDCFNVWRNNVKHIIKKKKSMADFPAWMSNLTIDEQVANLEKPQPLHKTVANFEIPPWPLDVVNKIPVFDIVACELFLNVNRVFKMDKYFKLVISLPDVEESPTLANYMKRYTEIAFLEDANSEAINKPEPLVLQQKYFQTERLALSVRRIVGPRMMEGEVSNTDALSGASSLIFLICHDSTSIDSTKRRLHEVMKAKHHYNGIPVAFIVTNYLDEEQMQHGLKIDELMYATGIRAAGVFHRKPKSSTGLEDMFCKAIYWITKNVENVPSPYCTTAENLVCKYMNGNLWERFEFHERTLDEFSRIKMDLRSTIHIHNRACRELLKIITDGLVNKCSIGAPEFLPFISPIEVNQFAPTQLYEVMPSHFGSSTYKQHISQLLKCAEIEEVSNWPPETPGELYECISKICHNSNISEEGFNDIWRFISFHLTIMDLDGNQPVWNGESVNCIPWIIVIKLLSQHKWAQLDFRDHLAKGNHDTMVAMNLEDIASFIDDQWWYYQYNKEKLSPLHHFQVKQTTFENSAIEGAALFDKE